MSISTGNLYFLCYARLMALRRALARYTSPWVFGRVACLGLDVHRLLATNQPLLNTQKGRVDMLLEFQNHPCFRPKTSVIAGDFIRQDILGLVAQLECFTWPTRRAPSAVFMDSYAELTDQLFVARQGGAQFCTNYSDLSHSSSFTSRFECRGLMKDEDIEVHYRRFFSLVRKSFGSIPIVFMHFPKELEERAKFRHRHDVIVQAIEHLAAAYPPFHIIAAPPGLPDRPRAMEAAPSFPYHYNRETYVCLASQIQALNLPL